MCELISLESSSQKLSVSDLPGFSPAHKRKPSVVPGDLPQEGEKHQQYL